MRRSRTERITKETIVKITLNIDGKGSSKINTGIRFLNHLLTVLSFHGTFNLEVVAKEKTAVNGHHLVEDVGLTLGQALNKALGERREIHRFGNSILSMDDALVVVSVDMSGRAYFESNLEFKYPRIGDMSSQMVDHILKSMSETGRFNLHVFQLRGFNDHHKAEAVFKALGMALNEATKIEPGRRRKVPSVKGVM